MKKMKKNVTSVKRTMIKLSKNTMLTVLYNSLACCVCKTHFIIKTSHASEKRKRM